MSAILAIESSCDDTGAAVIVNGEIRSNIISSQKIHSIHGGVVPELASRDHQKNIVVVVNDALEKANLTPKDLDAIACTAGPGLIGSLLVGINFAKGMALALNKPLIEVNHIHAHLLAHFIGENKPSYPFLCLLVSGGHTQIVLLHADNDMEIIGKTIDDAVGEAFDKGAKILGLDYPGGPLIDKLATNGNAAAFKFNYPQVAGYDYSFSGLKTALLYMLRDNIKNDQEFIQHHLPDLCASWQFTLVDYLLSKFRLALAEFPVRHIGIAGGVAANSYLRKRMHDLAEKNKITAHIPDFEYCIDNAAMIAQAATYKLARKEFSGLDFIPFSRSK